MELKRNTLSLGNLKWKRNIKKINNTELKKSTLNPEYFIRKDNMNKGTYMLRKYTVKKEKLYLMKHMKTSNYNELETILQIPFVIYFYGTLYLCILRK